MSEAKRKKPGIIGRILPVVLFVLVGAACGYWMVKYLDRTAEGSAAGELLLVVLYILCVYAAVLLQIIIHEAGHLLFGRLTGYGFSSFRIGSFMWIKDGEKIKLRRYSLPGIGGQCLCTPPEMNEGRFPYVLYNLGGSLTNLASALLFFGLAQISTDIMQPLLMTLATVGAAFALMNGIPMRLGMVDNDGYNAVSLGKNAEALRSFWVQMTVVGQIASGIRLKDMPDDWFGLPSEESMKNSMTAVMGVFFCSRLMDQMKLKEAGQTIDKLLQMDTGIVGLHRSMLRTDRIYCELVGENRQDWLNGLLDKQQRKIMTSMKSSLSVLRSQYAYALLAEKDKAKASSIRASFDKAAEKYPYPREVDAERKLMTYAEGFWSEPKVSNGSSGFLLNYGHAETRAGGEGKN